jgi:hypothetical protein
MKKVLILELDITTISESWIVALQKIDYEMDEKVIKHVIFKQTADGDIMNVPSYKNLPFVISFKEEERE